MPTLAQNQNATRMLNELPERNNRALRAIQNVLQIRDEFNALSPEDQQVVIDKCALEGLDWNEYLEMVADWVAVNGTVTTRGIEIKASAF